MRAIHINIIEVFMTTGLKKFGGRSEPKKSALEKDSTLQAYVSFKQAKNKTIAKTLLHADFILC